MVGNFLSASSTNGNSNVIIPQPSLTNTILLNDPFNNFQNVPSTIYKWSNSKSHISGTKGKQRTAEQSSQPTQHINPIMTRRRNATVPNRGHVQTNCIYIPTGTKVISQSPSFLDTSTCHDVPSLLLTNACHIMNKIDELHAVIENNNIDLSIVTESWLSNDIPTSGISAGSRTVTYRKDRANRIGGGVVAFVSNRLPTSHLTNLEKEEMEVLWLLLSPHRLPRPFSCIIIAGIYFPPGKTVMEQKEMNDYLTDCLDEVLLSRPGAGIVVCGDFNKMNFNPVCRRFNLRKCVRAPTRGANILDQIITNMSTMYNDVIHLPPLGNSDHQCLLMEPKIRPKLRAASKKVREMKPKNFVDLTIKLNQESWDNVFESTSVDDKVKAFTSALINIINTTMPMKTVRMHPSDKAWMTTRIKLAIKKRQRSYTNGDTQKYQLLRDEVSNLIATAKVDYYKSKASGLYKTDPARWYKEINALTGISTRHSQAPISADSLDDLAEKLQNAFTSTWNNETSTFPIETPDGLRDEPSPLPSIGQVKFILKTINPKKATGSDGIPAWLLKRYHEELAVVVHDIVCTSIKQKTYPTLYKHGLISPVPKIHPPVCIETDFRQISVLPQMAKVLEKVQLLLNGKDLDIRDNQHAFTKNRSTVSALVDITQSWFDSTDDTAVGRKGIHALFLDFRKAFDYVNHNILLTKLASSNINKGFWEWIRSFLRDRTQQVKLSGILSSTASCPAGVPQGSVLSPSLFNVFINDLEDAIPQDLRERIRICKYADDCTIYEAIAPTEISHMQQIFDSMQQWATNNKMALNGSKTKDMWITFKDMPEPNGITLENNPIERVPKFKLLGVYCQENLKWNSHVENITGKANKRLFHLRECRKARLPVDIGITIFCSKIRPLLEYASPIWGGLPNYLTEEIEKVQNRSLSIIGIPKDSLEKLGTRRIEATKRELQRIIDEENHPCFKFIINNIHKYNLRSGSTYKPAVPFSGTERHKHSFLPRSLRLL